MEIQDQVLYILDYGKRVGHINLMMVIVEILVLQEEILFYIVERIMQQPHNTHQLHLVQQDLQELVQIGNPLVHKIYL